MAFRCPKSPPRPALLAALLPGLALLASCTGELPAGAELSGIGVVEGRVTEAGAPVAADVIFRSRQDSPLDAQITAHAGADGRYRAELPLGTYVYWVEVDDVAAPGNARQDTVQVGRTLRRKDVTRGRARVTLNVPAFCNGERARLHADARLPFYTGWTATFGSDVETVVTDETAVFDLRLLPPAGYALRLEIPGVLDAVIVPALPSTSLPDTLHVGVDSLAERSFDYRGQHASLSGRATGSPEQYNGALRIDMVNAAGKQRGATWCESDGSFRLDVLLPEPVRLRARGNSIEQWFGGDSFETATVYDLQPGDQVTGATLTGGGLRVRFEGPGDRVNGGASLLVREEGGVEHYFNNSSSNPVVIDNLRPGRVRLFVLGGCAAQPWLPQWYDGAASAEDAAWLDIVGGQLTEVTMTLASGGSISGTLTSHDDDVWGVSVALHDLDGHRLCPEPVMMYNRKLELRGLPDGDYLLGLFVSSSPWWYPGTWQRTEAVPLSIVDGGTVSGLVWPLPFPYAKAAPGKAAP